MASLSDIYTPSEIMAMLMPNTSAYRPDLPSASTKQYSRARDFGPRWNEQTLSAPMTSLKGYGWLGPMTNSPGSVMSEYSMTDENGRSFPSFVPTLSPKEVEYLMNSHNVPSIPSKDRAMYGDIYRKANSWANLRGLQGMSPFID